MSEAAQDLFPRLLAMVNAPFRSLSISSELSLFANPSAREAMGALTGDERGGLLMASLALPSDAALRALLNAGVDPNSCSTPSGLTGLMWAVSQNRKDFIDALIPHSDPRTVSDQGESALRAAAQHSPPNEQIIKALIDQGASPGYWPGGARALKAILEEGRFDPAKALPSLRLLLERCDPMEKTPEGEDALDMARKWAGPEALEAVARAAMTRDPSRAAIRVKEMALDFADRVERRVAFIEEAQMEAESLDALAHPLFLSESDIERCSAAAGVVQAQCSGRLKTPRLSAASEAAALRQAMAADAGKAGLAPESQEPGAAARAARL